MILPRLTNNGSKEDLYTIAHNYEHMFTIMNDIGIFHEEALKVLYLLANNPYKEYYQRELSRLTGVSIGYINRLMRKLLEVEIVVGEKRGKSHFYRYNLDNPISRELKKLFNITEIYNLYRELRNHATKILLYGSCSEGTDTIESDIDILIISREKDKVRNIIDLYRGRIERRISPLILTQNEYMELKNRDRPLYENIKKGIVLWER